MRQTHQIRLRSASCCSGTAIGKVLDQSTTSPPERKAYGRIATAYRGPHYSHIRRVAPRWDNKCPISANLTQLDSYPTPYFLFSQPTWYTVLSKCTLHLWSIWIMPKRRGKPTANCHSCWFGKRKVGHFCYSLPYAYHSNSVRNIPTQFAVYHATNTIIREALSTITNPYILSNPFVNIFVEVCFSMHRLLMAMSKYNGAIESFVVFF